MLDLFGQAVILFVLLVGLWWGYRRWIGPHAGTIDAQGKGLLLLVALTFMGGLLGSPFWWFDEPRSFSWDLPPLASRMLAAAGWSFAVVAFLTLQRPSLRRLRLVLLLLVMYLAPLAVVILLFHLERFNFSAPITYGFFLITGGMALAALWYLIRQPRIVPDGARDSASARPETRLWLGLIAVLTAAWGVALFVTDQGPSELIWVWPGDLLTSRLIGVMLLTIAVGSAASLRYADRSWLMLAMTATYGAGVALASFWNTLAGKPIKPAYLLVFGVLFAGSALLMLLNRAYADAGPVAITQPFARD